MRRYNRWAGNPEGTEEDITRCIVEVFDTRPPASNYQCQRKRGFGVGGLYCKQHAKMLEKGISLYIPKEE